MEQTESAVESAEESIAESAGGEPDKELETPKRRLWRRIWRMAGVTSSQYNQSVPRQRKGTLAPAMGLPGAGAEWKDLASACVLCPCPGLLSYLTRSPIAEGNQTKEEIWSSGTEGSGVGIIGGIQTEVHSLRRVLLKYIKAYCVDHECDT
jgi:hypothetical protein